MNAFSCAKDMYGTHCTGIVCPNSIYFLACETIWRGLNECISMKQLSENCFPVPNFAKMAGKELKN